MPEYALGLMFSGLFAVCGLINRKIDMVERRQDHLELKIAETYVTKADLKDHFTLLLSSLDRLEDKVDAHVSEDKLRITKMQAKYNL